MASLATTPFFTLTDSRTSLTFGSQADRYRKNLAAIRLLRQLQREERAPQELTDQERSTLAHYTAFGDSALLRRAFGDEASDLDGLLSADEAAKIKRTSLTAFYTSTDVLQAKWAALTPILEQLDGTITMLEPSFGIGNYVATMPLSLRARAQITAVELDLLSSQIARYLHPDVQLFAGQAFEETELPRNTYDLLISNVPFGNDKVFDPRMPDDYLTRTIHDYFIARAMTLVRPGGLIAVITSYGTLDKRDARVRTWLAERAELVSAVRLPQGAFSGNAGTECGADLLIFRRYADSMQPLVNPTWVETAMAVVPIVDDAGGHYTNNSILSAGEFEERADGTALLRMGRVFADQPEQVIGSTRIVRDGQRRFSHVAAPPDGTIGQALAQRLASLPHDLVTPRVEQHAPAARATKPRLDPSHPRVAGLLEIYDAAKRVIHLDVHEQDASAARAELNAVYDTFVASFGPIHTRPNQQALKGEPELLFLKSLESEVRQDGSTLTARKADLFTQPTLRPTPRVVVGSMTADEALIRCLDELGRVDIARIVQLCSETEGDAAAALTGRVYRVPETGEYVTADEYLSGNIRTKLEAAQHAALAEPSFNENVQALQAVLPAPLTPGQIKAKFGAPWVPTEVVSQFICSLIPGFYGSHYARGKVSYHRPLARWTVADEAYSRRSHAATVGWGTGRVDALEIIEKGLNNQNPVVYDELKDGSRVLNQKETLLAREKLERIKEHWAKWIWQDADRTELLCRIYNQLFNSSRRRDFDGSHLSLPGINTAILRGGDLAAHQKDAVWMMLQVPSVLLDLCVGAGKTFICLAAAHELKRLGLARKVLITVPNHLVEQWASEANRLYPDMRVLAMSADDFSKQRRGTFLSRIATEEWDVVICAHTSFTFIEVGSLAREYIQREVDELRTYLTELKHKRESSRSDRRSIKEIERKIVALETRLKEREQSVTHDDARIITWEELGIDALFVDEAHEFKNLSIPTAMGSLPGVPKGDSKRAFDMRLKTWELRRRGGRVVFATGTPVLNTLGEVFIMQKYLQEEVLAAHGIEHFDAWASTFAETQTVFEMTPDGGGFRLNTRLCKFVNLPELFNLWFQMTFSRSREQLGLPTPKLISGKPIPLSVPGTPTLKQLVRSFVARVEAIKRGAVEPWEDNILKVTSDGRKAALDVRLVVGGAEEPACKINLLVQTIAELYRHYDEARATQLVYCELSTPKAHKPAKDCNKEVTTEQIVGDETAQEQLDKGFVYHEIREKLARLGIPHEQVAFIQEHNTKTKRAALFAAINRGDVRVLLASKQSTGMNIQKRLVALHNLDAPWRPGDLEQRVGRIERQGNRFPEVYVCNYVTEGSFDGYIWQTLETKARFIGQMRSGDVSIREIDDISEVVLSAAEIKAIASGNPKVMRKVQLDAELSKLESLHSSYRDTQARMRTRLKSMAYTRERMTERRGLLLAAQQVVSAYAGEDFKAALAKSLLTQEAVVYLKREAAGKALLGLVDQAVAAAQAAREKVVRTIGSYHGLLLRVQAYPFGSSPEVFLALERDGQVTPLSSTPIKCETPLGAFASTDSQIRGIAEGITRIDAEAAAMDNEEAQIQLALNLPWDQADRYTQLRAELETLNAELSRQKDDMAEATASAAEAPTSEHAFTDTGKLEVVEVSDAETIEVALPAQLATHMPLLPPVALPEPSDLAAMTAAVAHLAALDATLLEAEEIEVESEVEAAEVEVALGQESGQPALAVRAVELAVPQGKPTFSVEPQDVIVPKRTSKATVTFGNLTHIEQVKPTKQKQAKSTSVATTSDMFAAAPVAALQMSLF